MQLLFGCISRGNCTVFKRSRSNYKLVYMLHVGTVELASAGWCSCILACKVSSENWLEI